MTDDQLKDIQNFLFNFAKESVSTEGHCPHLGYLVTSENMKNVLLKDKQFDIQLIGDSGHEESPGDTYAILTVNMTPDDPELLQQLTIDRPDAKEVVQGALQAAQTGFNLSFPEACTRTLEAVMQLLKINRKDIVARNIRIMCKKTKAFAFIHTFEGYHMEISIEESHSNRGNIELAKDSRSIENVTCVMECYSFTRQVFCKINRESPIEGAARDSGKVLSLGDVTEFLATHDNGNKMTGRFSDVLIPVD